MPNVVQWEPFFRHNRPVEEDWRERMQSRPEWDQRPDDQIESAIRAQFRENGEWLVCANLIREHFGPTVSSGEVLESFGFEIVGKAGDFFITKPPDGWKVVAEGWYPSGVSFSVAFLDASGIERFVQITNRYLNQTTLHLAEKVRDR